MNEICSFDVIEVLLKFGAHITEEETARYNKLKGYRNLVNGGSATTTTTTSTTTTQPSFQILKLDFTTTSTAHSKPTPSPKDSSPQITQKPSKGQNSGGNTNQQQPMGTNSSSGTKRKFSDTITSSSGGGEATKASSKVASKKSNNNKKSSEKEKNSSNKKSANIQQQQQHTTGSQQQNYAPLTPSPPTTNQLKHHTFMNTPVSQQKYSSQHPQLLYGCKEDTAYVDYSRNNYSNFDDLNNDNKFTNHYDCPYPQFKLNSSQMFMSLDHQQPQQQQKQSFNNFMGYENGATSDYQTTMKIEPDFHHQTSGSVNLAYLNDSNKSGYFSYLNPQTLFQQQEGYSNSNQSQNVVTSYNQNVGVSFANGGGSNLHLNSNTCDVSAFF